jgi:hypothetical protein
MIDSTNEVNDGEGDEAESGRNQAEEERPLRLSFEREVHGFTLPLV